MHLLPTNARCSIDSAPRWLAEKLAPHTRGNGPDVRIIYGKKWHELSSLPHHDDVVVINCPGVTTQRLRNAGFGYVRRFAAVPNLQNARWFISLDTPHVAAASFSLYTPARKSAKLKKKAAQVAARMKLPIWYRDEVVVASRTLPPLEEELARVFPGKDLRLGLSAGAPEPARNRKASAAVIALDGEMLGYVKIGDSEISRGIVQHEATILPALADRNGLAGIAPRLIWAGEVDHRFIAAQAPLPGRPAVPHWSADHDQFLAKLRLGPNKTALETNLIAVITSRFAAMPTAPAELRESFEGHLAPLSEMEVPMTIIHGDFAPWNLRMHDGRISAFDWEYAELDGLPLIDETHFILQVGYLIDKWDVAAAKKALQAMADRKPIGLDGAQVRALQAMYLIDNITRLLAEGYGTDNEMIAFYLQLLATLKAPTREAVLV